MGGFLGGLDSIRCFGRTDIFLKRFHSHQLKFITTMYWQTTLDRFVQSMFGSFAVSIFSGGLGCLLLLLSMYETPLSYFVTPGNSGLVLAYCAILAFQGPVVLFMTVRVETMVSSVQRIADYSMQPTEDSIQKKLTIPPKEWPACGGLQLKAVEMRYQDSLPLALKGVSFEVAPGEKVGIVGRTGSGKSSILLSCFRMVECAGGRIVLDGQDLAEMPLSVLRGRLGVIPQDSWLFSGTVRSNIDVDGSRADEELWAVLRHVQLEAQAREWTKGLDHEVKEKGENLSVGTAQLLCLARVLLKRPKLLFMDEATASVDSETDNLVQETIRKEGVLPAGCSIITVAHRIQTVIDYDRIVVLQQGVVVECGEPHALLQKDDGHLSGFVRDTGESSAAELRARAADASRARGKA